MPREYRKIKGYEKEIIKLWEEGKTLREKADKLGFTKEQVQEFKTRYNRNQRKLSAGIVSEYIHFYNNERIQLKTKLTPLEKRNQFVA